MRAVPARASLTPAVRAVTARALARVISPATRLPCYYFAANMAASSLSPYSSSSTYTYPPARRDDSVSDELHGTRVADPYRWLEDPDSEETRAWVAGQNDTTARHFATFADSRAGVRARLEALQSYERVGAPFVRGAYAYVFRNSGLQNQDVLYQLPRGAVVDGAAVPPAGALFAPGGPAKPFLDLNAAFPSGTTSLGTYALSEDGRYFAYGLSTGGSDWQTLRVRDTATGTDLPDVVPWTKFTRVTWTHDGLGFFYSRHPAPGGAGVDAGTETSSTTHCMVMYHALGDDAGADVLVYAHPDQPVWRFGAEITDDGAYLLLTTHKGTDPVNRLYYAHLPSVWAG